MIFGNDLYFESPFTKKKHDLSQKKFYCLFNVVLRSNNIYLDKMQK